MTRMIFDHLKNSQNFIDNLQLRVIEDSGLLGKHTYYIHYSKLNAIDTKEAWLLI